MFGALTQLTDAQGFIQPNPILMQTPEIFNINSLNPVQQPSNLPTKVEDPLRELVLCSNDKNVDPEKLKFLAQSAANLVNDDELNPQAQGSKSMKTLAGIFAGTETFVKKVEENLTKKYAALEPSDSDGFGGNLLPSIGTF